MTEDDRKPFIRNVDFGFGIAGRPTEEGRYELYVPQQIIEPGYDGPALRAWAEVTAVAWLEQVAPHRLATLER